MVSLVDLNLWYFGLSGSLSRFSANADNIWIGFIVYQHLRSRKGTATNFEGCHRDFLRIGSKDARINETPEMLPFLVQL
jgi:hypothetical protein